MGGVFLVQRTPKSGWWLQHPPYFTHHLKSIEIITRKQKENQPRSQEQAGLCPRDHKIWTCVWIVCGIDTENAKCKREKNREGQEKTKTRSATESRNAKCRVCTQTTEHIGTQMNTLAREKTRSANQTRTKQEQKEVRKTERRRKMKWKTAGRRGKGRCNRVCVSHDSQGAVTEGHWRRPISHVLEDAESARPPRLECAVRVAVEAAAGCLANKVDLWAL